MSRPYFETKVVKVRKKECQHEYKILHYKCVKCGYEYKRKFDIDNSKPKGNWVNGENLDKIKFPVQCSYNTNGVKKYGIIFSGIGIYTLYRLKKGQEFCLNNIEVKVPKDEGLRMLIKDYDIHILKGKIIIFEEEE